MAKQALLNIEPILTFHIWIDAPKVQEQVRAKTSSQCCQYTLLLVFLSPYSLKDSLAKSQGTNNIRFTHLVIKKFYKVFFV